MNGLSPSYTYELHSTIIFPGSRISDFSGNSRAQKLNKAQTKRANITGVQFFAVSGILNASIEVASALFYHLSLFSSSPFAPTSLFASTSAFASASVRARCRHSQLRVRSSGWNTATAAARRPPLPIPHLIRFLCQPFLSRRWDM